MALKNTNLLLLLTSLALFSMPLGASFPFGTRVAIPKNGDLKNPDCIAIEYLRVGQKILSLKENGSLTFAKIKKIECHKATALFCVFTGESSSSSRYITASPHQTFYDRKNDKWVDAQRVDPQVELVDHKINCVSVRKCSGWNYDAPLDSLPWVVALELEEPRVFFVEETSEEALGSKKLILTHNGLPLLLPVAGGVTEMIVSAASIASCTFLFRSNSDKKSPGYQEYTKPCSERDWRVKRNSAFPKRSLSRGGNSCPYKIEMAFEPGQIFPHTLSVGHGFRTWRLSLQKFVDNRSKDFARQSSILNGDSSSCPFSKNSGCQEVARSRLSSLSRSRSQRRGIPLQSSGGKFDVWHDAQQPKETTGPFQDVEPDVCNFPQGDPGGRGPKRDPNKKESRREKKERKSRERRAKEKRLKNRRMLTGKEDIRIKSQQLKDPRSNEYNHLFGEKAELRHGLRNVGPPERVVSEIIEAVNKACGRGQIPECGASEIEVNMNGYPVCIRIFVIKESFCGKFKYLIDIKTAFIKGLLGS